MSESPEASKAKDADLSFRPLTDGLGFHPFSDGLPYAPVAKTTHATSASASRGTGATAAGMPQYARSAPRISVPVVSAPTPAPIAVGLAGGVASPSRPAPIVRASAPMSVAAPVAKAAPAMSLEPARYGFGYMMKRVFAYTLDTTINLGLLIGALSGTLLRQKLSPDLLFNPGVVLITAMFLVFFNWALVTAQEVTFGTSVGKRLFGLQLRGSLAAIFLRAFFFMPSLGFCGIGLVWALFDRRRRCWHDLVVDFQPVEIATL